MSLRALLPLLLALSGCAALTPAPSARLASPDPALRTCAQWFRDLDARVERAGARDAQEARLSGFPYLRVNRTLSSFGAVAGRDAAALDALVDRMQALDLDARRAEIGNASPAHAGAQAERDLERTRECARVLRAADLADPDVRGALPARLRIPDAYSSAKRVMGLYALTRYPFSAGVRRHKAEVTAAFASDNPLPAEAQRVLLTPPVSASLTLEPAALAARLTRDALGIPLPDPSTLAALFDTHAPEFEIEDSGPFDKPGALRWLPGDTTPGVDTSAPVVYRKLAWTRYADQTLLQLVYTAWFSERPAASRLDILAGRLDGVTWRVTLAPDGAPVLFDTIHPCGCYHMFFPTPRAQLRPAPEGIEGVEFMFSPQALPTVRPGERVRVRIATRTHYVTHVSVVAPAKGATPYAFADHDDLRSLPRPDGSRASLFTPEGLVAGTERPERLLFWPMGIASAGAMRQWGHHATAFVGRRHFDDADLIEKRFVLSERP